MPVGTVNFFNTFSGFGVIEPDGSGKDTFVNISAVQRAGLVDLREGQRIQYDLEPGRDGDSVAEDIVAMD